MGEAPTTIEFPIELPVVRTADQWHARAGDVDLRLSNLEKVFWPEAGYTKGDLLTYYFNVALTILPHVVERPLTMRRTPEGINGPYWYEKDAPAYTPEWVPILEVAGEERDICFVTICDVASLLWVVNLGCIELHPHHTRGTVQEHPTYAVFDLDPFPPAGFEEIKQVARLIKLSLDRLDLDSYPKTSGGAGLQIYVPLDGTATYEDARRFVMEISRLVHLAAPTLTTLEWEVRRRAGKVFLDANMNRAGASFAAPYSVRARWAAPISMPFQWDTLETLDPESFTLPSAVEHVLAAPDPFAPVAAGEQDLRPAMADLGLQ